MRFLKLTMAYDGENYVGWQVQPNGQSIQESLESAWSRVTGESIRITASGRTDAGVHAVGQVCSLSTNSQLEQAVLKRALNANLPDDIRVLDVAIAPDHFHAIRDAVSKTYRYRIQHGSDPDLFERKYCWYFPNRLDIAAIRQGTEWLVGKHDFASFQASGSARESTVRNIESIRVEEQRLESFDFVEIEITADGFLYNMVRNIVGSLVQVGLGKQPSDWISHVLAANDRGHAGITAPARGLILVSVRYD